MNNFSELHTNPDVSKILVLQTAFIGDVILALPLLRAISTKFSRSDIHFLTIPSSRNIVENLEHIDRLWIFDKHGIDGGVRGLLKFSARLRAEKFEIAVVPHRSLRSALLVFLAGIPRRIGFNRSRAKFLYTDVIEYSQSLHEIERNLRLLDGLLPRPITGIRPEIQSSVEDQELITRWMDEQSNYSRKSLICMAPGSIWPTKRWPAQFWGALIDMLAKLGFSAILIGSKDDQYLVAEISRHTHHQPVNAMGIFTLRQSAEIIHRCDLLISNDSAPTHMGVAVGTPVLTLFGSTVPEFGFYPYGENNRVAGVSGLACRPCTDHGRKKCPEKHFRCMMDLRPEIVFDTVRQMLNEDHKSKSKQT